MTLSERTEQPMSEAELAGIEDAHRKHRDTPSSYCMDCGHDWPCPTVRCVKALRSERAARGRVEAAARAYVAWQYRERGAPRFTLTDLRAALSSTEGTSKPAITRCSQCGHIAGSHRPMAFAGVRCHTELPNGRLCRCPAPQPTEGTSKSEEHDCPLIGCDDSFTTEEALTWHMAQVHEQGPEA